LKREQLLKAKSQNYFSTTGLQIERRVFADITILYCNGRLVVRAETECLFDAVVAAMCRSRCVLLNLSGVTAIDSGGLGMLVLLHQFAAAALCDLNVCGLAGRPAELIELTNLHSVLDIYADENTALASFLPRVA
jgi:anti-sigma B factor antagonist